MDKRNLLNAEVQERALACLERFGQRLRDIPTSSIRIVGTKTLHTARNAQQFISKTEKALGNPIHIIAGTEEARLIYQGVAHSLQSEAQTRLVMDIGGGSTEYIVGTGQQVQRKESLNMGCVSVSKLFFKNGNISSKHISNRRKIKSSDFSKLPPLWVRHVLYLTSLLRLAVVLHYNRSDTNLPEFKLVLLAASINLQLANDFLKQSLLTCADLEQESDYLKAVVMTLN